MRLETIYRVSLYVLLTLAAVVLNMDADPDYARLFPVGVAVAGAVAFFTTDRDPRLALSPQAANLLGLASVGLVYLEFTIDPTQLVLACGHWLCYLALVKLFRPKTPGDDWYLIVLGLMQVLVGCYLSQSDRVGFTLLAWAIGALWVLSLFYLTRESGASGRAADAGEPYPGLMAPPFLLATLRAAATTLLCGVLIFLVMPRSNARARAPGGQPSGRTMTGFSDKIRLGQMGEILENESVVMTVELRDESGNELDGVDDVEWLWRGVVLTGYERGSWERMSRDGDTVPLDRSSAASGRIVLQKIHLEVGVGDALFLIRPFLEVRPAEGFDFQSPDGTVSRESPDFSDFNRQRLIDRVVQPRGAGPLDYRVWSLLTGSDQSRQPGELLPRGQLMQNMKRVPDEIADRVRAASEKACAGLEDADATTRARAMERYLRDSGTFRYDLTMSRSNTDLDPIVDFLDNTRRGHCEYFASSLAMMLRSQGIPSRVVNGFKGGDWDFSRNALFVRQKHAHSWVEAYVAPDRSPVPIWLTLDPTPGGERLDSVEKVSQVPKSVRGFSDLVRYYWVFYVAGFNAERQEEVLYGPVRRLIAEARDGFRIMRRWLVTFWGWATGFPSLKSFVSVKGFVVSCLAMLTIVGVGRAGRWLWRWLARRIGAAVAAAGDGTGITAAYARLARLMAHYGVERPPGETPREFGRRAAAFLSGRVDLGASQTEVPGLVVDAYYQARFGGVESSPDAVRTVDARVDALEAALKGAV